MVDSITDILVVWEELGIFYYALPFLLIFALVFAILQKIKITGKENRPIDAVIALTIGLLALQFDEVPIFFQTIFPKVGIGLAVLLVALILMGLFVDAKRHEFAVWTFFSLGGIIGIIILITSFEEYSWWTGGFWYENSAAIIAGIVIIVFVFMVINSGKEKATAGEIGDPFRIIPEPK